MCEGVVETYNGLYKNHTQRIGKNITHDKNHQNILDIGVQNISHIKT